MIRTTSSIALAGVLALGACAVPAPAGPSVMALPGDGKNFTQFQQEDATCRNYASGQIGNASPGAAANQSAAGSAAVGTLLGAAAGAALGAAAGNAGAGAAIGAGTGLALGASAGAANAAVAGGNIQGGYDMAYTQCMYANGNKVVSQPRGAAYAGAYPYGYGYPYYGPAYIGAPVVEFGFGGGWGGWGGRHWDGGWHR